MRIFAPVAKSIEDTSDDLTKKVLTSKENEISLENLNDKFLEKMNDRVYCHLIGCLFHHKSLIQNLLLTAN